MGTGAGAIAGREMTRRLIVRPSAEQDLIEARDWYDTQKPSLGDEFLAAVDERFEYIREFPEAYAVEYKGMRSAGLRRFPYIVYYRIITPADLEVLAVLHAGRNPRVWRSRA